MLKSRLFIVFVLSLFMFNNVAIAINKKDKAKVQDLNVKNVQTIKLINKKVYMFGIARSYADSLVYMTNISEIENAQFDKNTKKMFGLDLYSNQLYNHIKNTLNQTGYICTTFYGEKRNKVNKQFLKIKQILLKDKSIKIGELGVFDYKYEDASHIYYNNTKQEKKIMDE